MKKLRGNVKNSHEMGSGRALYSLPREKELSAANLAWARLHWRVSLAMDKDGHKGACKPCKHRKVWWPLSCLAQNLYCEDLEIP